MTVFGEGLRMTTEKRDGYREGAPDTSASEALVERLLWRNGSAEPCFRDFKEFGFSRCHDFVLAGEIKLAERVADFLP